MGTSVSVVYVRHTKHVLAAFSRNGSPDGKLSEEQLQTLFAKRLSLRLLKQGNLHTDPRDATIQGHAPIPFEIEARYLAAVTKSLERPLESPLLLRPTQYSLVDEQPEATPEQPTIFRLEMLTYELKEDGLRVTVKPKDDTTIRVPIAMWALLRLAPQAIFVAADGIIPENAAMNQPSVGEVPFPSITSGETHQLLLLIAGFQPIWDSREVGEPRTWKP